MSIADLDASDDRRIPRPSIPVTLYCACGVACVCAFATQAFWKLYLNGGSLPFAGCIFIIGCSLLLCAMGALRLFDRGSRRLRAWILFFAILLGVSASIIWYARTVLSVQGFENGAIVQGDAIVLGDPRVGEYGSSALARLEADGRSFVVDLKTDESYEAGTVVTFKGHFTRLGDAEWDRSRFMKGARGVVRPAVIEGVRRSASLIEQIRSNLLHVVQPADSPSRALLAGLVCGRTTELNSDESMDWFSATGLSHLVAVSGGHLACIVSLLESFLLKTGAHHRVRMMLLLFVMLSYVLFCGASPSAMRSFLMVAASTSARLLERRDHALSGLSIAVMGMVAVEPASVYDLGFQLSVASVLFILIMSPIIGLTLRTWHVPASIEQELSVVLAAQWATLPITAPTFGTVSLIAPAANIIMAPVFTFLLMAGLVILPLTAIFPVAGIALDALVAMVEITLFCVRALASVPFASLAVSIGRPWWYLLYLAAALLYLRWESVGGCSTVLVLSAVSACCACTVIYWGWFSPAQVVVLDVGQGDAILIREGSQSLLVDAGVDESTLDALVRNHVTHLDAIVITHWDLDHWGGLPAIVRQIRVDRLVVAEGAADVAPSELGKLFDKERIIEIACKDRISVGGFSCEMMWPLEPVLGDENADSIVLRVTHASLPAHESMLLTGDTEVGEASEYASSVGDIAVLKLGHHGSSRSIDEECISTLDPELVIASAGKDNRYGHPSSNAVEIVASYGARFLCTIERGDIKLAPVDDGLVYSTSRRNSLE